MSAFSHIGSDRVLMDVLVPHHEIFAVADAVVGEASLPDRSLGAHAVREATFDQAHRSLESDGLRRQQEMDVVGHDDEGVEQIVPFCAVMLKGCKEQLAVRRNLKDAAGVIGAACDEESTGTGGTVRDRHGRIVRLNGVSRSSVGGLSGCLA